MDRVLVYPGALPQDVDVLTTNKSTMLADGYLAQAVFGTPTAVDGLLCTPTTPTANLVVNVSNGSIYQIDTVDQNAYGSLGTDVTTVYKQGILKTPNTTFTITPPGTSGQSQVYLIEAELQDVDTGSTVLSYYNASNPASPFAGPANAGTSQNTLRTAVVTLTLKAGTAATTGTQVAPTPDAGYVPLWLVTVANGQTQITSASIAASPLSPAVTTKLPQVPPGVQSGKWLFGTDTSVGGNVNTTATTSTSSAVLTFGTSGVPSWMANGLKVFDQTTPTAITGGQTVLSFTTSTVTLTANVNVGVGSGDTIVFSNDLFAATVSPAPASLTTGMGVRVKLASGNVGAATLNLNGLGAVAIHRANGSGLSSGDLVSGMVAELTYDGSAWQIQNYFGGSGANTNTFNNVNMPYALDTSTSSNTITVNPTPAMPGTIAAGQVLICKLANPITGATTIGVTGVTGSPFSVVGPTGSALVFGAAAAGEMLWMLFDGTRFQIVNPPLALAANTTIYVNVSTGSDSLDGTQATVSGTRGPLQHVQTAVTKAFSYPPSQFTITIQVADGTYAEAVATPSTPGPAIIINGDSVTPSSVLVTGSSSAATFQVNAPNTLTVQNLKASSAAGTQSCFVANGSGASLTTLNTVSGATTLAVFSAENNGSISVGTHTFAGGGSYGFLSGYAGSLSLVQGTNYTISTSITFNGAFAAAFSGGQIFVPSVSLVPTFSNPGNVTGNKFFVTMNAVINTAGLNPALSSGINYFPGTTAGIQSLQGLYI